MESLIRSYIKETLISEGRYDRAVGYICDIIWHFIKKTRQIWKITGQDYTSMDDYINLADVGLPKMVNNLPVTILLRVIRNVRPRAKESRGFDIDGSMTTDGKLVIEIYIDPEQEPDSWVKLNSHLHGVVAHEMTHVNQYRQEDIDMDAAEEFFAKMERGEIAAIDYLLNREEVPAMVRGFYRQAKNQKRPFSDVINDYLEAATKGRFITPQEKKKVMSVWIDYAKKHLPAVQIKESKKKSSRKRVTLTAPYENDLKIALNWLSLKKSISSCGKIQKKDSGYSVTISPKISKEKIVHQVKERFGYFVSIK